MILNVIRSRVPHCDLRERRQHRNGNSTPCHDGLRLCPQTKETIERISTRTGDVECESCGDIEQGKLNPIGDREEAVFPVRRDERH